MNAKHFTQAVGYWAVSGTPEALPTVLCMTSSEQPRAAVGGQRSVCMAHAQHCTLHVQYLYLHSRTCSRLWLRHGGSGADESNAGLGVTAAPGCWAAPLLPRAAVTKRTVGPASPLPLGVDPTVLYPTSPLLRAGREPMKRLRVDADGPGLNVGPCTCEASVEEFSISDIFIWGPRLLTAGRCGPPGLTRAFASCRTTFAVFGATVTKMHRQNALRQPPRPFSHTSSHHPATRAVPGTCPAVATAARATHAHRVPTHFP